MSNGLDPDQAQCSVRPDLGPNCLQRLAAEDKICLWQAKSTKIFTAQARIFLLVDLQTLLLLFSRK